jgi:phosphatidylglycerophosphatase A
MSKNTPIPQGFLKNPIHLLALGFGTGCVPKMPGTIGTLVGILFYLPLVYLSSAYSSWTVYIVVTIALFLSGIWLCEVTANHLGVHDHGGIVWDEIVGFLITMTMVPPDWRFVVLGFVLFRLFDIWKPWPISWLDRKVSGGLGIMLDDVLAGIYALIVLQIIVYLL